MQGIFTSEFTGKKKDIEKLLLFIKSQALENQMYNFINEMISLPENYSELDDEENTRVSIGMDNVGGSGNINFFLQQEYFNDVCKAAPELSMEGEYSLLDTNFVEEYRSKAGYEEVEYDIIPVCPYCGEKITNKDEIYYAEREGCSFCNEDEYAEFLEDSKENIIEEIIDYYDDNDIEYDEDELQEMTAMQLAALIDKLESD